MLAMFRMLLSLMPAPPLIALIARGRLPLRCSLRRCLLLLAARCHHAADLLSLRQRRFSLRCLISPPHYDCCRCFAAAMRKTEAFSASLRR